MPVLRLGQQRGCNVLAAGEHHAVDLLQHLGRIRSVVAPRAYQCAAGVVQVADTLGIEVGRSHRITVVVKILSLHLRQHCHRDARLAEGLHDVRAELIVGICPPGDGDTHFFLAAVRRVIVVRTTAGYHTCAANNNEDGGEHPNDSVLHSLLFSYLILQPQDATDALVDALFGEHALDGLDHGIDGLDEVLWAKHDVGTSL